MDSWAPPNAETASILQPAFVSAAQSSGWRRSELQGWRQKVSYVPLQASNCPGQSRYCGKLWQAGGREEVQGKKAEGRSAAPQIQLRLLGGCPGVDCQAPWPSRKMTSFHLRLEKKQGMESGWGQKATGIPRKCLPCLGSLC